MRAPTPRRFRVSCFLPLFSFASCSNEPSPHFTTSVTRRQARAKPNSLRAVPMPAETGFPVERLDDFGGQEAEGQSSPCGEPLSSCWHARMKRTATSLPCALASGLWLSQNMDGLWFAQIWPYSDPGCLHTGWGVKAHTRPKKRGKRWVRKDWRSILTGRSRLS